MRLRSKYMNILIIYYSRTNTTKQAVKVLASKFGARIEELKDPANRMGVWGYIMAGRDAMRAATADIGVTEHNPADFDIVVLATPVWAGTMTPAVRAYIHKHRGELPKVAFLTTQGSARRQRVFDELKKECGREPIAELQLTTKEVKQVGFEGKIEEFVKLLSS